MVRDVTDATEIAATTVTSREETVRDLTTELPEHPEKNRKEALTDVKP